MNDDRVNARRTQLDFDLDKWEVDLTFRESDCPRMLSRRGQEASVKTCRST